MGRLQTQNRALRKRVDAHVIVGQSNTTARGDPLTPPAAKIHADRVQAECHPFVNETKTDRKKEITTIAIIEGRPLAVPPN